MAETLYRTFSEKDGIISRLLLTESAPPGEMSFVLMATKGGEHIGKTVFKEIRGVACIGEIEGTDEALKHMLDLLAGEYGKENVRIGIDSSDGVL